MKNLSTLREEVRAHVTGAFAQLRQNFEDWKDQVLRLYAVYWVQVEAMDPAQPKPVRVRRGAVSLDAYASLRVTELYQAGKLSVGDVVLLAFIDGDEAKPIVLDRVKT